MILRINQKKVRFFSFGGWTKGVFIRDEAVLPQVKAAMARAGLRLGAFTVGFALFEEPTLDCPMEVL